MMNCDVPINRTCGARNTLHPRAMMDEEEEEGKKKEKDSYRAMHEEEGKTINISIDSPCESRSTTTARWLAAAACDDAPARRLAAAAAAAEAAGCTFHGKDGS